MLELTWALASQLADLLGMVDERAKVHWTDDGGETIREGMVRCINRKNGETILEDEIRITTSTGWEVFLPVSRVLELMDAASFMRKRH